MARGDIQTGIEIAKRVHDQMRPKTQEQFRLQANLQCAIVNLEDGLKDLRHIAHGIKTDGLRDELINQIEEVGP